MSDSKHKEDKQAEVDVDVVDEISDDDNVDDDGDDGKVVPKLPRRYPKRVRQQKEFFVPSQEPSRKTRELKTLSVAVARPSYWDMITEPILETRGGMTERAIVAHICKNWHNDAKVVKSQTKLKLAQGVAEGIFEKKGVKYRLSHNYREQAKRRMKQPAKRGKAAGKPTYKATKLIKRALPIKVWILETLSNEKAKLTLDDLVKEFIEKHDTSQVSEEDFTRTTKALLTRGVNQDVWSCDDDGYYFNKEQAAKQVEASDDESASDDVDDEDDDDDAEGDVDDQDMKCDDDE